MEATLIATAAVTVIAALTTAVVTILSAVRSGRAVVEAKAAVVEAKGVAEAVVVQGHAQTETLTNIAKSVDGNLQKLLQELADSRALNAAHTGTASDLRMAKDAQERADEQQVKVDASKEAKS